MSQPRVFAVQQPTGRGGPGARGPVVPSMDLTPAETFGRLVFLLDSSHNPFRDPVHTAREIERRLGEEAFAAGDMLLLVGSPILIGLVTTLACAHAGGRLRFLQWARADEEYRLVEVDLGVALRPRPHDRPATTGHKPATTGHKPAATGHKPAATGEHKPLAPAAQGGLA